MIQLNKRKVAYAALHSTIFIPGHGQVGPTLDPKSTGSKIKDLTLFAQYGLLLVSMGGKDVPIPLTNVSHMVLASVTPLTAVQPAQT